jgi:UDP-N-acetylmuramoylalanine--D-glutamate ligase
MNARQNLFYNKKFLIYGFGKSGFASFKYLNQKNDCIIIDDNQKNVPLKYREKTLNYKQLKKNSFDYIVLSPGIDINKCKLSKYLKKNGSKVITELDIFYLSYPKIKKITITGTNGKSTTSKILFDVLKAHKKDVRLTGNIGNPILLERKIKKNTIFIIEASSYQLDYSKFFRSDYSLILNLHPDHLERHGNFKNYVKAKFKLIQNQSKKSYAFIEKQNKILNYLIKKNKIKSKIYRVNYKKYQKYSKLINNRYFINKSNIKNLSFVFALSKFLKLRLRKIIETTNKFKGLDFRQQIIYDSKKLMIINDSKSTSLSSTELLLESFENIYWILGGLAKKGDQLKLNRKYFGKINAFIYGKDKIFFSKILKKKIKYKISKSLNNSLLLIFKDIKKNSDEKKVILFSPSAASFDQFKNFEDRGKYFNKIIKNYIKKI